MHRQQQAQTIGVSYATQIDTDNLGQTIIIEVVSYFATIIKFLRQVHTHFKNVGYLPTYISVVCVACVWAP